MKIEAESVEDYLSKVQDAHKPAVKKLRETIKKNLPDGFEECLNYGMIGYVVPKSTYPAGYHVKPNPPLPFLHLGAQKNFIGLYHMGIYSSPDLYKWWVKEYEERVPSKLDMGKSCVRLKKTDDIPYDLVAELCQKMSVKEWIALYEQKVTKK